MGRPQHTCNQPHGTVARYTSGCSCLACCETWRVYSLASLHGEHRMVDADVVRKHIRYLQARGWSLRAVEAKALVGDGTVRRIMAGKSRGVRQSTAAPIFALTDVAVIGGPNVLIPARPTRMTIQHLLRRHTLARVARASGLARQHIRQIQTSRSVTTRTAQRVRDAVETLRASA